MKTAPILAVWMPSMFELLVLLLPLVGLVVVGRSARRKHRDEDPSHRRDDDLPPEDPPA